LNQRKNLLVLYAAVLSLEVIMCCISWVHSEIGVILEDVWLEILLNDSIHANPVEERKQIHFVQNGVETKVDSFFGSNSADRHICSHNHSALVFDLHKYPVFATRRFTKGHK
jgi:hypothetical protein